VYVYTHIYLSVYTGSMVHTNIISKLTEECSNEENVDKKIEILYKINSMLPMSFQIAIPSLVTDDYVSFALWTISQRLENKQFFIKAVF
jgi:hypothetical protein